MRRSIWNLIGALAVIGVTSVSFVAPPAHAASSFVDVEPNNTCVEAQALGLLDAPLTVAGGLDGLSTPYPEPGTETPNIDFFRLSAPPDSWLQVSLGTAYSGQGTLQDSHLGAFDGNCFPVNQAVGYGQDAQMQVHVPSTGDLVIGVSSCCDSSFTNGGAGAGSYTLAVDSLPTIGSISGQLVDSHTGQPVAPDSGGYISVSIYQCSLSDPTACAYIGDAYVDQDGRFLITPTGTSTYHPLTAGSYYLTVNASGYRALTTSHFQVDNGQDLDLGELQLSAPQPIGTISGRVVDARSDAPVAGAQVYLERCETSIYYPYPNCYGISYGASDADGSFAFSEATLGFPLYDELYQITVSAPNYEYLAPVQFSVAGGADYSLGDVALSPITMIGSVSGRLVDATTGRPLTSTSAAYNFVTLMQCDEFGSCYSAVAYTSVDENGYFRFSADNAYNWQILRPGSYAIAYGAEQYVAGQTAPFTVGEGQDLAYGDIAVQPYPVRLLDGVSCGTISARGGTCTYTLRVVNGQNKAVTLRAWSTVATSNPYSAYASTFQPQEAQKLRLRPGETRTVSFSFDVPARVAAATSICTQFFVANDAKGFYFAPVNQRYGACVTKDANGDFKPVAGEKQRELRQRMNGLPPSQRGRR